MSSILIVEDSPVLKNMYQSLLSKKFFLDIADDAESALNHISGNQYDLIITDANLPNMSGIELIKELKSRQSYKTVPMMIVTSDVSSIKDAKQYGVDCWLLKPVEPESLIKAIDSMIERYSTQIN